MNYLGTVLGIPFFVRDGWAFDGEITPNMVRTMVDSVTLNSWTATVLCCALAQANESPSKCPLIESVLNLARTGKWVQP